MAEPCPTCSGPSRETAGMVCQTCGADYGPPAWLYPVLLAGTALHACLICGGAVPEKGIAFHDAWHTDIASAAIEAQQRLDRGGF